MLPNLILSIERDLPLQNILAHYKARQSNKNDGHYFCPLRRCTGDKHPHFLIEQERARDQYDRPIDFTHHINKDVVVRYHWVCEHSHTEGYGSIALLSAILGYTTDLNLLTRHKWEKILTAAADICGKPLTELEAKAMNGWLMKNAPQDEWRIWLSDDFTPEALRVLSLEGMDGVEVKDIVHELHERFGLWQVEKYITAGCWPSSDHTEGAFASYERRAHALFPIFAFCYNGATGEPLTQNPEKRTEEGGAWVARIVMPAFVRRAGEDFDWKSDFWTAFNTHACADCDPKEYVKHFRKEHSIFGDDIAMECATLEWPVFDTDGQVTNDPASYGAESVLMEYGSKEELVKEKEVMTLVEKKDSKGNGTGKFEEVIDTVPMHSLELKLNKCVLCKSPLDGVATYMWLNYPRMRFPNGQHKNNYWHVTWLANDQMQLNVFENRLLSRIAIDTFELFGNDRAEISLANTNAIRYNYLRLCMLPTAMSEMDPVDSGLGIKHVPHTPIDFFRYYKPTMDEEARNMLVVGSSTGCKALMLQKELNSSASLMPFTKNYKKKKRAGERDYSYEVNINAAWQMMTNKGYCRSLLPNKKRDTIGQCYCIDGHFVYERDPESVMADMRNTLENYVKDNATDPEDADMMMNAILRCKDLQNAKNITKLRLMAMPKSESYGPELDYFFFRNGCLEITPGHITFRSYHDIDFLVYASQVLPFDYHTPFFGPHSPISIKQNPDFEALQKEYQEARNAEEVNEEKVLDLKQRLHDMSIVGRWLISIRPTEDLDKRIVVPKRIAEDTQHNEWLRWWPFLRLLRCFANEHFAEEEAGRFIDADRAALMARMANLMFTIGRCIFRYRGVQYMPYFLENTVDREGKAQGGSGKSVLVEHFIKFVRYVCNVNGKDIKDNGDFAKNFSNFIPHHDDVVHIEDFPKMAIDPLFNYASGKFRSRSLFENPVEIEHSESPNIVITSNFMVQSTDESSLGRVQFGGMSHYFSREVAVMNKEGRKLDTIMPDIHVNCDQQDFGQIYSNEQRGQIIYTLAKCLQFTMLCTRLNVQVAVPGSDLLERLSRTEMGDSFYDWFTNFLQKPHIYNVPIAINEIFNSYRAYLDPSKARIEQVSRTRFYENMQKYCAKPAHGVLFMPIKPYLTTSEQNRSKKKSDDGTEKSYLRKYSSWLTRSFLDEQGRVHHARVLSKNAGESAATGGAVWFSQRGKEPKDADEFRQMVDAFLQAPDPEPILDADEQPITEAVYGQWTMLNTEEEAEIIRKAGGVRRPVAIPAATAVSPATPVTGSGVTGGEVAPGQDDLPF